MNLEPPLRKMDDTTEEAYPLMTLRGQARIIGLF